MLQLRKLIMPTAFAVGSLFYSAAVPAQAATATATMLVSATVLSFCNITALPIAFGNYSSAIISTTSTINVSCTAGTTYNVGLDVGTGGATATVAARQMTFGASHLAYQLTSDTAHTVPWGPTVGTNTVTGTATGLLQPITVYAQIGAGQLVPPGAYLDTVTATITY